MQRERDELEGSWIEIESEGVLFRGFCGFFNAVTDLNRKKSAIVRCIVDVMIQEKLNWFLVDEEDSEIITFVSVAREWLPLRFI